MRFLWSELPAGDHDSRAESLLARAASDVHESLRPAPGAVTAALLLARAILMISLKEKRTHTAERIAMRVKDIPTQDRPRERLLAQGSDALADRELLALLLGSGTAGDDAITLAGRMLSEHGTLYELSRADPHALLRLPGVGPAKAARVAAAFELVRRARPEAGRVRIATTADLARVIAPLLQGRRRERVVVVVCDSANTVLRTMTLTEGAVDRSLIPVRDVLTAHGSVELDSYTRLRAPAPR